MVDNKEHNIDSVLSEMRSWKTTNPPVEYVVRWADTLDAVKQAREQDAE